MAKAKILVLLLMMNILVILCDSTDKTEKNLHDEHNNELNNKTETEVSLNLLKRRVIQEKNLRILEFRMLQNNEEEKESKL